MVDLGAVFGSERNWATQFSHIGDQRLSRIQLKDTPDGVKLNGEWKFPQGKDRLAFEEMKYFEYRRKEPPAFVIDFWHKPGPTLAAYKNTLIQNRKNAALRVAQKKAKARVKRRIEKKKRHLAAADVTDYCRLPLSEKRDTIIPFRPAKAAIKFRNWFSGSTPDSNYPYSYPTKKGKDAKYVRNTIEFYYKGKFGLVNRAIKFLEDEYPHSEYLVEMRFLRANALFRLGYVESAEQIFREIFINYGKTPVALSLIHI